MTTLSNIFAHLPNGIIREIVSYTGVTYKKRNGKYMGQISKNDIRYVLLLTIPKKTMWVDVHKNDGQNRVFFCSSVTLTRIGDDSDRLDLLPSVYLEVHGFKYTNDIYIGNKEGIGYKLIISDWKGKVRNQKFEYYRSDANYMKTLSNIIPKRSESYESIIKNITKLEEKIQHNIKIMCIVNCMYLAGLVINLYSGHNESKL